MADEDKDENKNKENKEKIDELLESPKSVTNDAGSVTFRSADDAIKLDKYYEKKAKKKSALARVGQFRIRTREE